MIARIRTHSLLIMGLKEMAVAHPIPRHLLSCIGKLTRWIQTILQPSVKEHAKLQIQIPICLQMTSLFSKTPR